jgi:hypothetical protein
LWKLLPLRLPSSESQSGSTTGLLMSDAQMAELYERLVKGKSAHATSERVFLRGWNAGIDYAMKQMRLTCDEPETPPTAEESAA